MSTSVGTKSRKKQPTSSASAAVIPDRQLEHAMMSLENACQRVLGSSLHSRDIDMVTWQQRFQNIATPVSLVLVEYRGPRRFHYHYKHREDDDAVLSPVLENPLDMVAQVCRQSLRQCRSELVGLSDPGMVRLRQTLENALLDFLLRYRDHRGKNK